MNKSITLVLVIIISAFLDIDLQAMQRTRERIVKKQEMGRLFPQVRVGELAGKVQTNPSARDIFFMELIYEGMLENNIEKVQNALERGLAQGFDVNFKDNHGNTLLHYAVLAHNASISLLITHRADVNSKNSANQTPLYGAALKNNVEAAKQLIEHGADVSVRDNFNRSPLEHAIIHGSVAVVQLLLKTPGIDVDRQEITRAFDQRKEYMQFAAKREVPKPDQMQAFNKLSKILVSHLMTLGDLSIDKIVKNIDLYRDRLQLLPQELQDEINRRLAQQ